jgi:hypothetical protein
MAVRASMALLGGVVVLFLGWQALGIAAEGARETAVVNGSNESAAVWNMSTGIFEGIGAAASPAIVWGGVAAFILLALGLLVAVQGGGR